MLLRPAFCNMCEPHYRNLWTPTTTALQCERDQLSVRGECVYNFQDWRKISIDNVVLETQCNVDSTTRCYASLQTRLTRKKRTKWCSTWLIIILRYLLAPLPCLALILPTFSLPSTASSFFYEKTYKNKISWWTFQFEMQSLSHFFGRREASRALSHRILSASFFFICVVIKNSTWNFQFHFHFMVWWMNGKWFFVFFFAPLSLARLASTASRRGDSHQRGMR